jgi:hypothetical protein
MVGYKKSKIVENLRNLNFTVYSTGVSVRVVINKNYEISIIASSAEIQLPPWALFETALFQNNEIINRYDLGYNGILHFSDFDSLRRHIDYIRYELNR